MAKGDPKRAADGAPSKRRGSYHHGDLKRALLDATLDLIDQKGPEGFTLRAAAKAAGVSDAAPYHHFSDKRALLAAVGEEGFQLLSDGLRRVAKEHAENPVAAAHEMAIEYVVFAAQHPSHFRVMLGREVLKNTDHPELAGAAMETFTVMQGALLKGAAAAGATDVPQETLIFGSWALVHGLAFLAVDGHLGPIARDEGRLRELVRNAISLFDRPQD